MSSKELHDLERRAEELALSGEWGKSAVEINTRILEIDGRVAGAYTRLARCFHEQGQLLAAREMCKQVLTFDPSNRIALNRLGRMEKEMVEADERAYVLSISSYDEAFSVGMSYRERGKHELAAVAFEKAVSLQPGRVYAWNALGGSCRRMGDLARARGAYARALGVARNTVSLVGLAAVARDLRHYEEAVSLYAEVLRDDRDNVYALNGLGGVYMDTRDFGKAEECFGRASELTQGRSEVVKGLRMLRREYEKRGDNEGRARIDRWLRRL